MIHLERNKSLRFYIECNHCKHNAMFPVTSLLSHNGDNITYDEVLRRTRNNKCGFRGNSQMHLVYVGKSSLAQARSAINNNSHKDIKVNW